jgi:hypothetical protein
MSDPILWPNKAYGISRYGKSAGTRTFLTTALLDQEAEPGKPLYSEAATLTKCEKQMLRPQHRESRTNVHEPVAYDANIAAKQLVEFLSSMYLSSSRKLPCPFA